MDHLVFSTYVEVIPQQSLALTQGLRILHVCGGDPVENGKVVLKNLYSPRMWR